MPKIPLKIALRKGSRGANERKAAQRLNPAGPPPTHTISYISGCFLLICFTLFPKLAFLGFPEVKLLCGVCS